MALATTGIISLCNIGLEFSKTPPYNMGSFVRGGSLVPNGPGNSNIPTTTSNMYFSRFYGAFDLSSTIIGTTNYGTNIVNGSGQWGIYRWGSFTVNKVPSNPVSQTTDLFVQWAKNSSGFGSFVRLYLFAGTNLVAQTSQVSVTPTDTALKTNWSSNQTNLVTLSNGSVLDFGLEVFSGSTFTNVAARASLYFR